MMTRICGSRSAASSAAKTAPRKSLESALRFSGRLSVRRRTKGRGSSMRSRDWSGMAAYPRALANSLLQARSAPSTFVFQGSVPMDLKDRGCIVTGGFGALGAAVARTLRERGAKVALIDRADSPHPLIPSPQGGWENSSRDTITFGGVDLADPAAAKRAIDQAASRLGGLYALVNVAGAFRWETVAEGDVTTWDFLYSVNLKTALCASKAALPHLLSGGTGRIVNIGAGAATKASAGMGAYAASKAGVARLTEAVSEEVKAKGITVNAVLPSIIDTAANRKDMPKADFAKWVRPEAIGELIAFLLSDEAGAITGALIPISGMVWFVQFLRRLRVLRVTHSFPSIQHIRHGRVRRSGSGAGFPATRAHAAKRCSWVTGTRSTSFRGPGDDENLEGGTGIALCFQSVAPNRFQEAGGSPQCMTGAPLTPLCLGTFLSNEMLSARALTRVSGGPVPR